MFFVLVGLLLLSLLLVKHFLPRYEYKWFDPIKPCPKESPFPIHIFIYIAEMKIILVSFLRQLTILINGLNFRVMPSKLIKITF